MRGSREACGLDEACWQRIVVHAGALARRGPKGDLRTFIAAVSWILRTGAPWRDLAAGYGRWDRVYRRYRRWALADRWSALERALVPREPSARMLLIDSTIVKAHAHAAGALQRSGGQAREALGRSRGGFTTKLHALVSDAGHLVRFILTGGERHDITQAPCLVPAREGTAVVGDRAYDSDAFLAHVKALRMRAVVPSTRARRHARPLDRARYAQRNVIERWFGRMKMFRRVATRYDKTSTSYAGFIAFAAMMITLTRWLE